MINKIFKWISFNLRYLGEPPWDTGITPPEVYDYIQRKSPGRALDLGAGTGTNIITLAKAGWKTEGVEYALLAVLAAKWKIQKAGVDARIIFHDVTKLDFLKPSFDLVLDIGCYQSLEAKERIAYRGNLARLLKPGGTFLLYGFFTDKDSGVGITKQEIDLFSEMMHLITRTFGAEKGMRDSVWLEFVNTG